MQSPSTSSSSSKDHSGQETIQKDASSKALSTSFINQLGCSRCLNQASKDIKLRLLESCPVNYNRVRLIDWFLQLFHAFKLSWEAFWFAVELLDTLIEDFNYVNTKNIHLVGIVCVFISAKLQGANNLTIVHVVNVLGHKQFTSSQIFEEEFKILSCIFKGSSLQRTVFSVLMQKYGSIHQDLLKQAMEMLFLAFLKPLKSFTGMGVSTYGQLADCIISSLLCNQEILILENIRKEMQKKFKLENIALYVNLIRFD